ncbi:MAG: DEAD/DEAH box helicase family protein, partial [Campylobacter sp.]|nr:DEAD/DEAH box helicase family protein [Campylobacter sp.]
MIFENQPHQQDCIKNIIQVLRNFDFETHANLDYSLDEFYKTNKALNFGKSGGKNLDILMETGTGKTFVYINAIFEINRVYNQNKFIIFVPRKAILESVKQNLKLTKEYFYNIYKKHLFIYEYKDEKSLNGIISHFIGNEKELSVLLLTSSAINKKDNILNKPKESLFNQGSVLENIASLKPISFIDEPHLLKGDKFKSYFSKINSLYFRFGATFPSGEDKLSNLIYSLDSISAFKSYLVKQISVHTIIDSDFEPILKDIQNQTCKFDYYLDGIKYSTFVKKDDDLGEKLHYPNLSGVTINSIKNKKLYLSNSQTIELTTSYTLSKAQISTLLSKAIDLHFEKEKRLFKQNIKALTLFFIPNVSDFRGEDPFIKNEFSKIYIAKRAEILKDKSLDKDYRAFLEKDFDKDGKLAVMNGYFSGDSKAKGSVEDKEADDIRLILEKKEELLSFKTQLRFIFSVWALQEGWDNPNVFTLVKLASSSSETTKRQQVGRGLRLAVNEYGKRLSFNSNDSEFYSINALDVVINAKESDFIENLQAEIDGASLSFNEKTLNTTVLKSIVKLNEREISRLLIHLEDENFIYFDEESEVYTILKPLNEICKNDEKTKELLGDKFENFITFITPSQNKNDQIINANKSSKTAKIKKNLALEFKELWKSINQTSTIIYKDIDDDTLASEVAQSFDKCSVERIKVTSKKETFDIKSGKIIKNESEFIKDSEL